MDVSFDVSAPYWTKYTSVTRAVTIGHAIAAKQAIRLALSNSPPDGNYSFVLEVRSSAGIPSDPPLATEMVLFGGQSMFSPQRAEYEDCLHEKFDWARHKKVTLRDLWGPAARRRMFDEVMTEIQTRIETGIMPFSRFEVMHTILSKRLRLGPAHRILDSEHHHAPRLGGEQPSD